MKNVFRNKRYKGKQVYSQIDQLEDVISAVESYDKCRMNNADLGQKTRNKALNMIEEYNKKYGQGGISLSKARHALQSYKFKVKSGIYTGIDAVTRTK